eukprot:5533419-Prymnesium_polylepis.1
MPAAASSAFCGPPQRASGQPAAPGGCLHLPARSPAWRRPVGRFCQIMSCALQRARAMVAIAIFRVRARGSWLFCYRPLRPS